MAAPSSSGDKPREPVADVPMHAPKDVDEATLKGLGAVTPFFKALFQTSLQLLSHNPQVHPEREPERFAEFEATMRSVDDATWFQTVSSALTLPLPPAMFANVEDVRALHDAQMAMWFAESRERAVDTLVAALRLGAAEVNTPMRKVVLPGAGHAFSINDYVDAAYLSERGAAPEQRHLFRLIIDVMAFSDDIRTHVPPVAHLTAWRVTAVSMMSVQAFLGSQSAVAAAAAGGGAHGHSHGGGGDGAAGAHGHSHGGAGSAHGHSHGAPPSPMMMDMSAAPGGGAAGAAAMNQMMGMGMGTGIGGGGGGAHGHSHGGGGGGAHGHSHGAAQQRAAAGRNDTCPCGSGKKYKKCCGANK